MKTRKLSKSFVDVCRESTGSHFLDSGSAYGYHYEKKRNKKLVSIGGGKYLSASISTGVWLDEVFGKPNLKLTREFYKIADSNENDWNENIEKFAKLNGYEVIAMDNVYNSENDFEQVFLYHVLVKNGSEKDWIYASDVIVVIQTHNGCDVRGGYSKPYLVKADNLAENNFFEWVVGWSFISGKDSEGNVLSGSDLQSLDEEYQIGYSSYPTSNLERDCEVISSNKRKGIYKLKLRNGSIVIASPTVRY